MADLQELFKLATTNLDKYYRLANEVYNQLIPDIKEKEFHSNPQEAFDAFDIVLQVIIFKCIASDKLYHNNELLLFEDLFSKHHFYLGDFLGKIFAKVEPNFSVLKLKDFQSDEFTQELHNIFDKHFAPYYEKVAKVFALVDVLDNKDSFEELTDCLAAIIKAFMNIDHQCDEKEIKKSAEYAFASVLTLISENYETMKKQYDQMPKEIKHDNTLSSHYSKECSCRVKCFECHCTSYKEGLDKALRGLVYIETNLGSGSGFIIDRHGYVATCAHVVKDAKAIFVRLLTEDGEKVVVKADLKHIDNQHDVAVVKLENHHGYYLSLEENVKSIHLGDEICVLGFPFGASLADDVMLLEPTLTKGYISSIQNKDHTKFYYLDASARPGNSGGPIFNITSGKVIGYLCGAYGNDSNRIVFMRDIELFNHFLKENK